MQTPEDIFELVKKKLLENEGMTRVKSKSIVPPQKLKNLVSELVNEADIDAAKLAEAIQQIKGWKSILDISVVKELLTDNVVKSSDDISPWILVDGVMYVANPWDEEVLTCIYHHADTKNRFSDFGVLPLSIVKTDIWQQDKVDGTELDSEEIKAQSEELFYDIMNIGIERRSSDIHLQPNMSGDVDVKIRIDGQLTPVKRYEGSVHLSVVRHMFHDIAGSNFSHVVAEDTGFEFKAKGSSKLISVRVNSVPQYRRGMILPRVVMRLLDKSESVSSVNDLGLEPKTQAALRSICTRPQGFMLVTGPTGSGKSTTLFSLLDYISGEFPEKNIMTLEDPVEAEHPNFSQIQVDTNLSFSDGLRALLRQDPDVILVGEIRDEETAEIAFHAAMTGHLVFSTLHTNSSHQAIERINLLGINKMVFTESALGITAQRLVRRLCLQCREKVSLTDRPEIARRFQSERVFKSNQFRYFYEANNEGCNVCVGGYKGRVSIVEVLTFDKPLKDRIVSNESAESIKSQQLVSGEFTDLWLDGLRLVQEGCTSIDELDRNLESYESSRYSIAPTKLAQIS